MDQNLINSNNNNSNNCSNNLVNTINQRILARTMTTGNVEVLLPSRPQQTLYTMPLANAVPHGECKPRVLKYNSEPNSYFLPATSNKSWRKINSKIPVFLIHGKQDNVVPLTLSKKIFSIFPKAKKIMKIIKGGDHSLSRKGDLNKLANLINKVIY